MRLSAILDCPFSFGCKPSLDMYREIFESNREYLAIINKTGMKNGFTEREMEWIEQNYREDYCSQ